MAGEVSRRDMLTMGTAAGGAGVLAAVNAEGGPHDSGMVITDVDCFGVHVPWDEEDVRRGAMNRYGVVRITTTDGITGYSFGGIRAREDGKTPSVERIRQMLVGNSPFAIEQFLSQGLVYHGEVEHALWDIVGKAAGQPVHKLLGGSKERTKYYITMVWPGKADQSHLTPEQQAEDILWYAGQGYNAIKIRCWREDIMADVEVARLVMQKAPEGFRLMFDRTAQYPGWVWTFDQALAVAKGLEGAGAYWLEEPFEVGDRIRSAKLAKAVDMRITGGEHDLNVQTYAEYLRDDVFDIVQPDGFWCGGILTVKKIGAAAQALGKPCILHGTHSLRMFGWLQAIGSLTNCEYQEVGLIRPPILPHEQWKPGVALLETDDMFEMDTKHIVIPQGPGLGMRVNEDAVNEYRVRP